MNKLPQDESVQSAVADEVNRRLQKATRELEDKYSGQGQSSSQDFENGPTGAAYKEKYLQQQKEKKQRQKAKEQASNQATQDTNRLPADEEDDDEDGDLRNLREARLKQIKNAHQAKLENLGKGHGQYRDIVQDEFLAEVTSSTRVICHFYHKDFPRCIITDHHLYKLATRHIETKFIKIDAEKTPFFVEKLKIRTMPTLVMFVDGVAVDKILGFEGLADSMPPGKEDEWPTIVLARMLGNKNMIDKETIVDDDGVEKAMKARMEEMKKSAYSRLMSLDDDVDLLDD